MVRVGMGSIAMMQHKKLANHISDLARRFGGSRYCIARGYRHRTTETYFDDTNLRDDWQKEVYEYAADHLKPLDVKTVYDVGCGSGFKLVKHFDDCRTIGFDLEPTVSVLRSRYPGRDWRVCDFRSDGLTKADLVICADVIEHVLDPEPLMHFIGRLAARYIVFSTPDRDLMYPSGSAYRLGPPLNRTHVREWNSPEFEKFVSRYFRVQKHWITNRSQATQTIVCTPIGGDRPMGRGAYPARTRKPDLPVASSREERPLTTPLPATSAASVARDGARGIGGNSETVTVLMPVYNAGPYVAEAIESILQQTHRDFEFLIVDDGSTDDSLAILDRFAAQDSRIHLVKLAHQGVAAALNHGLATAHGAIVVRMDADDVSRPERIAHQLAYLADNPDVAVVGTAIRGIDANGQPFTVTRYPTTPSEIEAGLQQGYSTLAHPAVAFRRDIVQAAGGYRTAFNHAEDLDLWLRISERHRIANLPDLLVDLRSHGENVSRSRRREQALAGHLAKLAARERRAGRPDPTATLDSLCLADLERFELSPGERMSILLDLTEAAVTSYEATQEKRYLADAEKSLFLQDDATSPWVRRASRRLASQLWTAGERRRSFAAAVRPEAERLMRPARLLAAAPGRHAVADWLVYCADPQGSRGTPPDRMLSSAAARELVAQAEAHGVLPAVLRHFRLFDEDPALAGIKAEAQTRCQLAFSYALMLRHYANLLMEAAADLPVVLVKGPVFARLLYPTPSLRPFTDIDLLVDPCAVSPLSELLVAQGFKLADEDPDRGEWKWLHRDNEAVMVEVQTDLVHSDSLSRALSLTHNHIADIAETPAAQLIVATIHGALGGHFDKLRHAVDICQAARRLTSPQDELRFEQLMGPTGARLAAKTGLTLAGHLFDEPRCFEIARALGPHRHAGLARSLINPSVITSTMMPTRVLHSWRRSAFRELLKRNDA
jgi:glycosyltransferase involved in cell wall biosynthesis/SAM-dependent methyltransferase